MRILLYSRRKRLHNFFATFFAQGFTIQYKLMIYSKLHHFKGSQKVHKGSQESVNPLCEPYNKYNILYINKLWATHDQSCEVYVNPLKYATRWYSERLAYFVNPYNNLTPTLSEGEGDKPACVSCYFPSFHFSIFKYYLGLTNWKNSWKLIIDLRKWLSMRGLFKAFSLYLSKDLCKQASNGFSQI